MLLERKAQRIAPTPEASVPATLPSRLGASSRIPYGGSNWYVLGSSTSISRCSSRTARSSARAFDSDLPDCHTLDDPVAVALAILLDVQRDEIALPTPAATNVRSWALRAAARDAGEVLPGCGVVP